MALVTIVAVAAAVAFAATMTVSVATAAEALQAFKIILFPTKKFLPHFLSIYSHKLLSNSA